MQRSREDQPGRTGTKTNMDKKPRAAIIMGVAGCGKTTVGKALAEKLGCRYLEGDRFHPPENIEKMAKGIPLTDEDRKPWLLSIRKAVEDLRESGACVVAACSALKESYRQLLTGGLENVLYVHLSGPFELFWERLQNRKGHYMKAGMLESQIEALEPPDYGLTVDAAEPAESIAGNVLRYITEGRDRAVEKTEYLESRRKTVYHERKGRNMKKNADIGVIGMAVMGQNLVLNMNDHGYSVVVYNRTTARMKDFVDGPAKGRADIFGAEELEDFARLLKPPRKIMLMVKAGPVVDIYIDKLRPLLETGDIIIDGGNSYFADTDRRMEELRKTGIRFVGMGVSGGEEGARSGPSLMPGGDPEAWPYIEEIYRDIAAKTEEGDPCCEWLGPGGAGHYVKMVHNGIEYGDIQVISEGYHLLKTAGFSYDEMADIFSEWNRGELESYLIEITADILRKRDTDGGPLVEKVLDTAGQKGTGKWTGINSMELGVPVTLIAEAVFSRFLSAMKDERVEASRQLVDSVAEPVSADESFIEEVRLGMLASKIISYTQGFTLLRRASEEYDWELDYGRIADLWREGCIIRSVFLKKIKQAFARAPDLTNLLLDGYFKGLIGKCDQSWREIISRAVKKAIPVPAFSSALAFFDGFRSARLPANLLQATRDYFGAHTYERVDRPRGQFYHTDWTGVSGETLSDTYNV